MAPRHRSEVFAVITAEGKTAQKRNVLVSEHIAEGKYLIRLPPDRFVRPDTHQITITLIGGEPRTAQLAVGTGGNELEVHTYCGNDRRDATFVLAAERL